LHESAQYSLSVLTAAYAVVLFGLPIEAFAWGATGHEWVSSIAIEKLPDSLPGFVRAPEAVRGPVR
jgi:hypothetical protein